MNVFSPSSWLRMSALAIAMMLSFVACSQENGRDTDVDLVQAEAYIDIANVYRQQGQFRSAFIELQNALQLAPNNEQALRLLSRVNLDIGDVRGAIQVLEALRNLDDTDMETSLLLAEAYLTANQAEPALRILASTTATDADAQQQRNLLLGRAYTLTGNRVEAEQALQAILAENPAHVGALVGLSQLAYAYSDLEQARNWLDQATEADESDLDMWMWRGVYSTLNGQYPEAERAFKEALEAMGNYDMITAKRLTVLQAVQTPLQMQQKNDEAMRYAQIIAETPQGQFQNAFSSAMALFQEGNYEQAQQAIQSSLDLAPQHAESNLLLGMTNYALGNYSDAIESLSSLTDVTSNAQPIKTLAAAQIRLGNPEDAVAILREVRDSYPEDATLIAMLGIGEQAAGQYQESIESFNQALAIEGDFAEIHFSLAASYFLLQDYDSTISALENALSINPEFEDAKTNLIGVYINQNDLEAARTQTERWLQEDSTAAINNNLAANVAMLSGNFDQARALLNTVLESDPANSQARLGLAGAATQEQDYAQAQTEYEALLAREPTSIPGIRGLFTISQMLGTQAQAIAQVDALVNQYPAAYEPPLILSQFLVSLQQLDTAVQYAEAAYSRSDIAMTRTNLVNVLVAQAMNTSRGGDLETADQQVQRALSIDGTNAGALVMAAQVANASGDYDRAVSYADRLKVLQPESGVGNELEGDLLLANDERLAALAAYRRAWEVGENSSAASKLYLTLSRNGQQQQASSFIDEWLETTPENGSANMFMGMIHQQENREAAAIESYEIALRELPNNIIPLNNLAWLYQESNPERAIELATRAATLQPQNPNVLDTFGWILFQQGRREDALEVLQQAQQLAPESAQIREHLEAVQGQ